MNTPAIQPLIIGGGVAGLTAALRLAQRGLRPRLLEANPTWLGGRLRQTPPVSLTHNGQTWTFSQEHAVHGVWDGYVNFKALLAELDPIPPTVPAHDETWILGRERWVGRAAIGRTIRQSVIPAPLHYMQLMFKPRFVSLLGWRDWLALPSVAGGLFAAMSIDPLAEHNPLHGLSLADMTRGWSPHLRALFAGLARNALAADPEEIPAAGWIAFLRFYTLLRRAAWGFDYLTAGGGTAVCEPLGRKIGQLGGHITLGAAVQMVVQGADGGWQVQYVQEGQTHMATASHVVLAVDAPAAQTLLMASPDTADHAARLTFPRGIPTVVVRLWFAGTAEGVSEAGMLSGDFCFDNYFWLDQLQEEYAAWRRATGGSALEVHIYGTPHLLAQPDGVLIKQVVQDVNRAFPDLRGRWLQGVVQRNPATHTLFSVASRGAHLGVVTPWPHLYACGDWVYHETPALYLERAATTGMAAANALLGEVGLPMHPVLGHPAPEWFAGWVMGRWAAVRQRKLARKRRGGGVKGER